MRYLKDLLLILFLTFGSVFQVLFSAPLFIDKEMRIDFIRIEFIQLDKIILIYFEELLQA